MIIKEKKEKMKNLAQSICLIVCIGLISQNAVLSLNLGGSRQKSGGLLGGLLSGSGSNSGSVSGSGSGSGLLGGLLSGSGSGSGSVSVQGNLLGNLLGTVNNLLDTVVGLDLSNLLNLDQLLSLAGVLDSLDLRQLSDLDVAIVTPLRDILNLVKLTNTLPNNDVLHLVNNLLELLKNQHTVDLPLENLNSLLNINLDHLLNNGILNEIRNLALLLNINDVNNLSTLLNSLLNQLNLNILSAADLSIVNQLQNLLSHGPLEASLLPQVQHLLAQLVHLDLLNNLESIVNIDTLLINIDLLNSAHLPVSLDRVRFLLNDLNVQNLPALNGFALLSLKDLLGNSNPLDDLLAIQCVQDLLNRVGCLVCSLAHL